MGRPKKVVEEAAPEMTEEVVEEVVEEPKRKNKVHPEAEEVTDSEGRKVTGFVSADGKSVTNLAGATFAL